MVGLSFTAASCRQAGERGKAGPARRCLFRGLRPADELEGRHLLRLGLHLRQKATRPSLRDRERRRGRCDLVPYRELRHALRTRGKPRDTSPSANAEGAGSPSGIRLRRRGPPRESPRPAGHASTQAATQSEAPTRLRPGRSGLCGGCPRGAGRSSPTSTRGTPKTRDSRTREPGATHSSMLQ